MRIHVRVAIEANGQYAGNAHRLDSRQTCDPVDDLAAHLSLLLILGIARVRKGDAHCGEMVRLEPDLYVKQAIESSCRVIRR